MVDLSDIQAYSRRTGVDTRGFVYVSDKQGADELVNTTLQAWDKLESYETEIDKSKQELALARGSLSAANGNLSSARSRLASLESQLASLTTATDPDGSKAKALKASISSARTAVSQAESQVSAAQGRLSAAESKVSQLESGKLGFQRQLMDRLGLDSNLLTRQVDIRAQQDWSSFRPTNALEEWAKVVNTGMGRRDEQGNDVLTETVKGKEALSSFMRYGQWNFNQMIQDFTDKLLRAFQRAASGRGFSFTENN